MLRIRWFAHPWILVRYFLTRNKNIIYIFYILLPSLENSKIFGENTIPVQRESESASNWKSYPSDLYENLPALQPRSFAFI
jgi:hypothetical protein